MTDLQIVNPTVEILSQHKTPFLLNLLNNLRSKFDLKPAKAWKESKAKLCQEIIKLQSRQKDAVTTKAPAAIAKGAYDKKREAPKIKSIKAAKPERKPAKADKGDNELLAFIKSKGFTPKTARNRFRSHKVKKVEGRYVLNAEVKAALA